MTEIRRAATAVLVRENGDGLQVLMLRRHKQVDVGGGAWVFPGGRVDREDYVAGPDDHDVAARRAAVRETREEAMIPVDDDSLQFISHWTTPPQAPKRFSTWFFLGEAGHHEVEVDGMEIDRHRWCSPAQALEEHRLRRMELMPPTVVTLTELCDFRDIETARRFYAGREVPFIEPRIAAVDDIVCMLYQGDAGYECGDATAAGPRRRCWLEDGVWRYECR